MENCDERNSQLLEQLFHSFIDAILNGRFDEVFDFLDDGYTGVGMGEQGIIKSKEEALSILKDNYKITEKSIIEFSVSNFMINSICKDASIMIGEVRIHNTVRDVTKTTSIIQTIGTHLDENKWKITFTHASPITLSVESVEAYPSSFMEKTLNLLQLGADAENLLFKDFLTGISNRLGFEKNANNLIENYDYQKNSALFMIDLDNFKQINDNLGHQVGDLVLQRVAAVLRNTFRDEDVIGRMGGDEFMVYLTGKFSSKFLEKKADELMNSMRLEIIKDQEITISISIGIAYGRAKTTFEKFYELADIALYSAKNAGKNQYHIVNVDTNTGQSFNAKEVKLLSLQDLIEKADRDRIDQRKTPYEALVENVPGGVIMLRFTNDEIQIDNMNDWYSYTLGYSKEEVKTLLSENPFAFVHPDDKEKLIISVEKTKQGMDNDNMVFRVRHKDGHYIHINQVSTVAERKKDSITVYGIQTNVEETFQLKQMVEDSQKELQMFIDAIPGGVLSISFSDEIVFVHRNDWILKFLGYSKEEIDEAEKGDPFSLVHPEDIKIVNEVIRDLKNGEQNVSYICRLLAKNQEYKYVRVSLTQVD